MYPLKPKDGLNGPPSSALLMRQSAPNDKFLSDKVMHFRTEFSEDNGRNWKKLNQANSPRSAKQTAGLPEIWALQAAENCEGGPLKPKDGLNGPPSSALLMRQSAPNDEFLSDKVMHFRTKFSEDNGRNRKELNQGELTKIG